MIYIFAKFVFYSHSHLYKIGILHIAEDQRIVATILPLLFRHLILKIDLTFRIYIIIGNYKILMNILTKYFLLLLIYFDMITKIKIIINIYNSYTLSVLASELEIEGKLFSSLSFAFSHSQILFENNYLSKVQFIINIQSVQIEERFKTLFLKIEIVLPTR